MDQFRPDSDLPSTAASAGGDIDVMSKSLSAVDFGAVIQLLDRAAELERRGVPHGLVDRVFAASCAQLGTHEMHGMGDRADASRTIDADAARPALRLVGERRDVVHVVHAMPVMHVMRAPRGGRQLGGRIGSALAMAASIAIALVIGIPATHVALLARSGSGTQEVVGSMPSDSVPFAATLGRATGSEPVLVSFLQNGQGAKAGSSESPGASGSIGSIGSSASLWAGVRAVPISADSSTREVFSIIEAREVHAEDLADDLARMRRDANGRQ